MRMIKRFGAFLLLALALSSAAFGQLAMTGGGKATAGAGGGGGFCGGSFQICDEFSGSSRNTTTWDATTRLPVWTASTLGGSEVEGSGTLIVTPTASATRIEGRSSVTQTLTLVGKEMVMSMTSGPSTTSSVTFGYMHAANRGAQNFRWQIGNNFGTITIEAHYSNAGDNGTTFSATYSATDHVCFRIRETGSDIYWDTSPAGCNTWTNRRRLSVDGGTPGVFFSPNSGDVGIWVDNYNSNGTAINVTFSDFWLTL
jgi:hypothetical protein